MLFCYSNVHILSLSHTHTLCVCGSFFLPSISASPPSLTHPPTALTPVPPHRAPVLFFHLNEKSGPSFGRQSGAGLFLPLSARVCGREHMGWGDRRGGRQALMGHQCVQGLALRSRCHPACSKHVQLFPQPGQMAPLFGAREAVN